jgi:ATPase subunit of ABC transporter with duplicated ATPase domains
MAKRQKDRQHNGQKTEGQTTQWTKERRTDNTMAKKKKDRQQNGQKTEEQTTQWPKDRRTDNTMAKRRRTDNIMAKRQKDRLTDSGYSFGIVKLFSKDIFLHTFNVIDPSVKIQHLFNKLEVGDLC